MTCRVMWIVFVFPLVSGLRASGLSTLSGGAGYWLSVSSQPIRVVSCVQSGRVVGLRVW